MFVLSSVFTKIKRFRTTSFWR